jgi:coenzyme F420 hydrogenase subunit beta
LSFFCAGTPSTKGTLDLIAELGARPDDAKDLHYRGNGWPGRFRLTLRDQPQPRSLSYDESWSKLTRHRPLRCNLCPDGLGRFADISCGDAWDRFDQDDFGRSLIVVRTERGRRILHSAARAGYVTLGAAAPPRLQRAQQNLLKRRRELFGRLLALRLLAIPIPSYRGFGLFGAWSVSGVRVWFTSIAGTLSRGIRNGWLKRAKKEPVTG